MNYLTIQTTIFIGTYLLAFILIMPCMRIFHIEIDKSARESHLDGLRCLAALAVVACHISQHTLSFFGSSAIEIGNRIGILGVQIFFALTAYLFTKRALEGHFEPTQFYIARLRRIVPLYVFVTTIAMLFLIVVIHFSSWTNFFNACINMYSFGFLGAGTLNVEGFNALALIGVAWSLSYEWRFYLILPPLYYLYHHNPKAVYVISLVILVLAGRDFYQSEGLTIWPFFIVGSASAIIMRYLPIPGGLLAKSLSALFFVFLGLAVFFPSFTIPQFFLLLLAFPCLLLGKPRILCRKPLIALGRVSYSIYLNHYLVIIPIAGLAHVVEIPHAAPIWKLLFTLLVVVVLIPMACFTYKFIELPGMNPAALRAIPMPWLRKSRAALSFE